MSQALPAAAHRVTIAGSTSAWSAFDLRPLWQRRDLLRLLALRDIRVRYKQAALGAGWAILQPVITMVVLHLFFGRLLDLEDRVGGAPYPVFLFAGLLPWTLFASSIIASSNALVANSGILKKAAFPRMLIPVSAMGAPLLDFAIASVVLVGMMVVFQTPLTWQLLLLPAIGATVLLAVFGVGLILSAATAAYRDVRHIAPFLVQVGLFLTPVIYPISIVPERFHTLLMLNPMHGAVLAFRGAILGTPIDYTAWACSVGIGLAAAVVGLWQFHRVERRFADVI
ncbi:MAG: ABC transporter permease [Planctomycetota bacterium]